MLCYTYFKLTKLLLQVRNTTALLASAAAFSPNSQHRCKQQVAGLYSCSRTKRWFAHQQDCGHKLPAFPVSPQRSNWELPSPHLLLACFMSQGLDQSSSLLPFHQIKGLPGVILTSNYRQSKLEEALRSTGRKLWDVVELRAPDVLCSRATSGWAGVGLNRCPKLRHFQWKQQVQVGG